MRNYLHFAEMALATVSSIKRIVHMYIPTGIKYVQYYGTREGTFPFWYLAEKNSKWEYNM